MRKTIAELTTKPSELFTTDNQNIVEILIASDHPAVLIEHDGRRMYYTFDEVKTSGLRNDFLTGKEILIPAHKWIYSRHIWEANLAIAHRLAHE